MFRLLEKSDFKKGFVALLTQLTHTDNITEEQFLNHYNTIMMNNNHEVFVLEKYNKIITCGTLLVEPKFIHNCGSVGHIEDIVVDKVYRGQKLGKEIIEFLTNRSKFLGCYKILLYCNDDIINFYEKCEYKRKGVYMVKYFL